MKNSIILPIFAPILAIVLLVQGCAGASSTDVKNSATPLDTSSTATVAATIKLPEPRLKGDVSLEEALYNRRSIRQYSDSALPLSDVSQLLWAAQGITENSTGQRTAPSVQSIYPLEVYLIAGNVEGLAPGIYRYSPEGHALITIKEGDLRAELGGRPDSQKAPIDIVIAANYSKMPAQFGAEGTKWIYLECGHAAQNVCLQATALNLGTATMAGFAEDQLKGLLDLPAEKGILYLMPVGKKS
jgi:SagB-type dehydrogenase family enzyme